MPRLLQRVDQGCEHPRAAASDGMAQGYGPAVHVEPVLRNPKLLPHHYGGSGIGLVVLEEVDVLDPSVPVFFRSALTVGIGASITSFGIRAPGVVGDYPWRAALCSIFSALSSEVTTRADAPSLN